MLKTFLFNKGIPEHCIEIYFINTKIAVNEMSKRNGLE